MEGGNRRSEGIEVEGSNREKKVNYMRIYRTYTAKRIKRKRERESEEREN